jgi:hypothetical protein
MDPHSGSNFTPTTISNVVLPGNIPLSLGLKPWLSYSSEDHSSLNIQSLQENSTGMLPCGKTLICLKNHHQHFFTVVCVHGTGMARVELKSFN